MNYLESDDYDDDDNDNDDDDDDDDDDDHVADVNNYVTIASIRSDKL